MSGQRQLVMPKLGLTMTEGVVAKWQTAPGKRFAAGDVLVVVESEKTAFDVEAPAAGTFTQALVEETRTVPVGTLLAHWQLDGDAETTTVPPEAAAPPSPVAAPSPPGGRRLATPLARRLARDGGADLAAIAGSGPRGRIQAADVKAALAAEPVPQAVREPGTLTAPTGNERTMASRVAAAKRDIPHFYLAVDVDAGPVLAMRAELNGVPDKPRVSMTHLLIAAVVQALRASPGMNRVWTEAGIRAYDTIDVGIAVDTERGLMSPVVRDLGDLSFRGLAARIDDVVARARSGALRPEDQRGAAITLSNAGMHEVRYMTSIIVPGQSAILGIGSVQGHFRPDAAGAPVLRHELGVVLSADHRIHTGVSALTFLKGFERALQAPLHLLTGYQ